MKNKELILGGKRRHTIGMDQEKDAGNCAFTGKPLYRELITPHVADVERVGKGLYTITRADGSSNMIYDMEIEAANWRDALIKWYDGRLKRIAGEYQNHIKTCINRDAVKTVAHIIKDGKGFTEIGFFTSGGMVDTSTGKAVLDDMFATAMMMGYQAQTHTAHNKRYLIIGADQSEIGKLKSVIDKGGLNHDSL